MIVCRDTFSVCDFDIFFNELISHSWDTGLAEGIPLITRGTWSVWTNTSRQSTLELLKYWQYLKHYVYVESMASFCRQRSLHLHPLMWCRKSLRKVWVGFTRNAKGACYAELHVSSFHSTKWNVSFITFEDVSLNFSSETKGLNRFRFW